MNLIYMLVWHHSLSYEYISTPSLIPRPGLNKRTRLTTRSAQKIFSTGSVEVGYQVTWHLHLVFSMDQPYPAGKDSSWPSMQGLVSDCLEQLDSQIMFYPIYHTHSGWKEMLLVMHQNLPIAFAVQCSHSSANLPSENMSTSWKCWKTTCSTLSLDVSPFKNVKV